MKTWFTLEKKNNEIGQTLDTIVQHKQEADGAAENTEDWCTIPDLNNLFNACVSRWGKNWDLNKVITAINECNFD